ncbi:MAG: LON peptidase substrate-binding domain-containing protein [Rhodospirillales bacterium]
MSSDLSRNETDAETQNLPSTLPIFPLTGVLLLPRGQLPLNIFEPRYLAMTEDALGRGRCIGMVQPKEAGNERNRENPPVYETGCAGRIVSFSETGDGRYLITLLGVTRFRISEELGLRRGYRRAVPDYAPYAADRTASRRHLPERDGRLDTIRSYFSLRRIEADWSSIEDAPDEALVNSLAMLCPFEPSEKQALLECAGLTERNDLLMSLMKMAVHGEGGGASRAH